MDYSAYWITGAIALSIGVCIGIVIMALFQINLPRPAKREAAAQTFEWPEACMFIAMLATLCFLFAR